MFGSGLKIITYSTKQALKEKINGIKMVKIFYIIKIIYIYTIH